MADIRNTGVKMADMKCAAEVIYEGYLYMDDGSGRMTICAAITDITIGIAAYNSLDCQTGAAKTMTAGDKHAFYLVGSGAIVGVMSEAVTWQFGDVAYLGTTNGSVQNVDATTNMYIGHYIGKDAATATAGDLVQIVLDVPIGSTT